MLQEIINYFSQISPVKAALLAGIFTWFINALGASVVFLFRKINQMAMDGMLGFTGGVMISASCWGLISPAIKMSQGEGFEKVIPASVGFILGALFLVTLNKILPHLHLNSKEEQSGGVKTNWQRTTLLTLAITLHNIPEGLAIGVLFGGVAIGAPEATIAGAVTLAIGIGIQNFPEGMSVAMPLRGLGMTNKKSFFYGQASAIVEPIFAVIGAIAVSFFTPILPYALAFAAGAMVFVVIEEVIPEMQQNKNTNIASFSFIIGFLLMMSLDVVLS